MKSTTAPLVVSLNLSPIMLLSFNRAPTHTYTHAHMQDIGDKQTAIDNRLVVETFLQRFPHLRPSEFYLTSESYGGHYIPTLAKEIVLKNQEEGQKELINLKGFAVRFWAKRKRNVR